MRVRVTGVKRNGSGGWPSSHSVCGCQPNLRFTFASESRTGSGSVSAFTAHKDSGSAPQAGSSQKPSYLTHTSRSSLRQCLPVRHCQAPAGTKSPTSSKIGGRRDQRKWIEFCRRSVQPVEDIRLLRIEFSHVMRAAQLTCHRRDPFGRLLAAQALENGLPIVSIDSSFDADGVQRVW